MELVSVVLEKDAKFLAVFHQTKTIVTFFISSR
jgi:hypothetical protein